MKVWIPRNIGEIPSLKLTWHPKITLGKGDSYWKPSFFGAMLVSGSVTPKKTRFLGFHGCFTQQFWWILRLLRSSKTWVTLKVFGHPGIPVFPPWVSWSTNEKHGKTTAKSWLTDHVCELNVRITWSKLEPSNSSKKACRLQRTVFVFNGCFKLFYFIYGKNYAKNDVVKHNMRDVCFFTSVEAAILILEKQGWSKRKQQNHDVILIWWIQWECWQQKSVDRLRSRSSGQQNLPALRKNNPWTGKSTYTPITNMTMETLLFEDVSSIQKRSDFPLSFSLSGM